MLPTEPGRQRRLAYGEMLRMRQRPVRAVAVANYHPIANYHAVANFPTNYDSNSRTYRHIQVGLHLANLREHSVVFVQGLNSETTQNLFCSICQDDMSKNQICRKMSCFHEFHTECIDTWFTSHTTCPLCNFDFAN